MNILENQPLECPNCKINIMNGLSEFIKNGEIICPHCNTNITCSNAEETQNGIQQINSELNKFKNIFKKK